MKTGHSKFPPCILAVLIRRLGHFQMISSARSNSISYTAALLAVGVAAVLTHLLWRYTEHAPAPLFVVAVAFSAWLGGLGPGLAATIASFLAVAGLCVML